jgi:zinc transporter
MTATKQCRLMEAQATALPGLVWAVRFYPDGSSKELDIDRPITNQDGWLWLHFNLIDARACEFLDSVSDLPRSARLLLVARDEHQQLHKSDACIYGVLADLVCALSEVTGEIGFLHFAITETLVVSARRRSLSAVEGARRALRNGQKVATPAALLELIMDQMLEAIDLFAEGLAGQLDRAEERIVADATSVDRQVIVHLRHVTVKLHRQLATFRSLLHRSERDIEPYSKPGVGLATKKFGQRLDWLDSEIIELRDRAHLLQEEITLKTAEQTNRNLQVLATVTTVFLPASLVAGVFGMNVQLPLSQKYGFVSAVAILIVAASLVYWLLKRSGFLKR